MIKRKKKRGHKRTGKPVGQPPFVPTLDQRRLVGLLSGKLSWGEIALLINNPRTDKPISKSTLGKAFRAELAAGHAALKGKIVAGFHAALDERQAWAVAFGLRAIIGLRDGERVPQQAPEGGDERQSIHVSFVKPNWGPDDDDPLPRQVGHTPHYDPAPPGQKLLPSPTDRPMPILKRGSWMD
jgi:hypothetical protein